MQKSYIENYANYYNLKKSGTIYLNEKYEHVMSVIDGKIFYKLTETKWNICKSGDLLISIINNIPLHNQ
jgi:hypothetical protein